MSLIHLADLTVDALRDIWRRAGGAGHARLKATAAFYFEGNGVRTRTAFARTFHELGMQFVELPNLLKTDERILVRC